ncbi:hypothetical protein CH063_00439 [Colletotrichum higginsianum]|uniref:Uncharacterized protein n=1 Tax=Colletotrichum higginsianum (strain IMI 349063) TaxID=759273 RepID=H1VR24_COLHI|nr:hypothetical protein CH063_00439 [Colletotrichum higginsianum]
MVKKRKKYKKHKTPESVLLQRPAKLVVLFIIHWGYSAHCNVTTAAFRLDIHKMDSQVLQRPCSFCTVQ